MAFDVQTLNEAARCAECLSPNQKQNVLLYLLNGILEGGGSGGIVLHNLLSATHPDTVPGPPTRGALVVGNATPDWESLPIGAANRVLRSDGVDATWSQLVLTTDVTGILPVANGGTNSGAALNNNRIMVSSGGAVVEAVALTDGQLLIGSTGAAPVAAGLTAGANVTIGIGAGSITVNAVMPGGFTGFANPTASVGLAAVNGVATTAMRSDAAPPLDQAIAPTWTGPHIFSPTASLAIQLNPFGVAAGNTSELRFMELAAGGTNYTGFKAADAMAASEIYVLPDAAPSANRFLRAGAVAAGVSTLSWTQISLTADVTGILPVANGGTGTSTAFTQGSVIFAGVAGVFTQDNVSLFWDDANNRLGLGTNLAAQVTQRLVVSGQGHFQAAAVVPDPGDGAGVGTRIGFNTAGDYGYVAAILTGVAGKNLNLNGTWGKVGIGIITPITAMLHIKAGTATAATAPLKFNTGISLTTAEAGAMEFTTDDLFFTITTGTARKRLLMADPVAGLTSGRVPFATTNGRLTDDSDMTFSGSTLTITNVVLVTGVSSGQAAWTIGPFGAAAGNTGEVRYLELAAGGTNYTGFKAADAIAASEIYVLPNAAPSGNRFLQAAAVAGGVSALSWAQVSLTADVTGILPVANGGSGTGTAFTAGSVIFAGVAGVFSQDNANFFWDDANNQLTLNGSLRIWANGLDSTFIGRLAGQANNTPSANDGIYNTFVGSSAGQFNTSGYANVFLGFAAGRSNTTGSANCFVGYQSGISNTTGNQNMFFGIDAGFANVVSDSSVVIGFHAGVGLNPGAGTAGNVIIGTESSNAVGTGTLNTFIGHRTGFSNTSGFAETFVGHLAGFANTSGAYNTFMGFSAGLSNTSGIENTYFGTRSGYTSTTASYNLGIGSNSLNANVTGSFNVGLGNAALLLATGANNVALGYAAGDNLTTGSTNIVIGYAVDSPTATNSNTLTIGNLIFGTGIDGINTVLSTGNIGVGVITPLAKFHVTNSAAATVGVIIKAAAAQSANLTEWQNSSATVLACVDEVGKVGIGTSNPAYRLDVRDDADSPIAFGSTAAPVGFFTYGAVVVGDTSDAILKGSANSGVAFQVDNAALTPLAINKIGNVGIGTNSPLARLHVTNSVASTVATIIRAAAAQSANLTEWQDSSAVILTKVNSAGNVGVRMAATALTAYLHIAAGTTSANTAPIKLTSGTSMTAAEAGAVEFTTDDLFFTVTTGVARKRLLMADATAGLTSGKIPIATTNGRLIDLTASAAYTPTNVTTDRSWDCNATSIDEIADVLATVVQDLQAVGVLG